MSDILVTVDLGTFNAYEIIQDPMKLGSPKLKIIKSETMMEPRAKASEKFSDSAGRFYQGGGGGGMIAGVGEQHNIELETERRMIRRIADTIGKLVDERNSERLLLAAEKSISKQILEQLSPAARAKLEKIVPANLTKAPKLEIMEHFSESLRRAA